MEFEIKNLEDRKTSDKSILWNWNIAGISDLVRKNGRRIDMTYNTDIWKNWNDA